MDTLGEDFVIYDGGVQLRIPTAARTGRRVYRGAPVVDVDLYGDHAVDNSQEVYRLIRDSGPVVWLPRHRVFAMGRFDDVRAALRRADVQDLAVGPVVTTQSFTIDLAAKRAVRHGAEVRLTPTEWHLVEALVRRPGTLVSGAHLLAEVWGPGYEKETNYLRVYFAQLRRKLEDSPSHPRHFITEPGVGYRFEP